MTDTIKLEKKIEGCGLKKNYICEKLGVSRGVLRRKICNQVEFKASEIKILCELLDIKTAKEKEEIFFAR